MIISTIKNTKYFENYKTPNWSLNATDLIDPKYKPTNISTKIYKYHKLQLVSFIYKNEQTSKTYYAIFYIDLDGYMPKRHIIITMPMVTILLLQIIIRKLWN